METACRMMTRMSIRNAIGMITRCAAALAAAGATARADDPPAPPYAGADVFADTWVATDALGRTVPG